jgi:hypothetical protein
MSTPQNIDDIISNVKSRLNALEKERKALIQLLDVYNQYHNQSELPFLNNAPSYHKDDFDPQEGHTIRERVLGVVKVLIDTKGKSAHTTDIVNYIKQYDVNMGASKTPQNLVSSILSSEVKKKNGVLKKVRRGMYSFK